MTYGYRNRPWYRALPKPSRFEVLLLISVVTALVAEVALFWVRRHQ